MDSPAVDLARARGLIERFLAGGGARTRRAHIRDVDEFARFLGEEPAGAVARLLRGGPVAGRGLLLEYAIALRGRGLAGATVSRRLAALRTIAAIAAELGLIEWSLEVPTEGQVAAAIRERAEQASYVMPRHPSEVDRLDLQHYALRAALRCNHLAPVGPAARILDTGCGTGQWGFDMCQELPDALVVGLDLVRGKPDEPAGYRHVKGNILHGLPFRDACFDFVHQRLLFSGVPARSWPEVVADLVRVTRPGGWVELVEPMSVMEPMGPATTRLNRLALGLADALELDTTGAVFRALDGYLRDAGLAGVTRREHALPVGQWGGEVGSFMATDIRAAFTRICEVVQARSGLPTEEAHELIQRAQEEWERDRMTWTFAIAFGRRPVTAAS